jgi:hypothetical protein
MLDTTQFLNTTALDQDGQSVRIGTLVVDKPVAFVFLRHYG